MLLPFSPTRSDDGEIAGSGGVAMLSSVDFGGCGGQEGIYSFHIGRRRARNLVGAQAPQFNLRLLRRTRACRSTKFPSIFYSDARKSCVEFGWRVSVRSDAHMCTCVRANFVSKVSESAR